MSWLFGLNKPQQQQPSQFPPAPGGGGADGTGEGGSPDGIVGFHQPSVLNQPLSGDNAGRGRPADGKTVGAQVSYSFDSTALERAAGAAKELEKSKNAPQAFELTRMQEITRQKEHERGMRVSML